MMGSGLVNYVGDVVSKSGPIGLVTVVLFFVCLGVGLERLAFWMRLWGLRAFLGRVGWRRAAEQAGRVEELVRAARFSEAGDEAARARQPVLRLMGLALQRLRRPDAWKSTRDQVVAETLGGNVTLGRRFLITAIQSFGVLGMMGTCTGLYAQMNSIGAAAGDMAALQGAMSGMGEAFTTTLVGLAAAALTTLIWLPNEVAIERFGRELRRVDSQIQAALAECVSGCGSAANCRHAVGACTAIVGDQGAGKHVAEGESRPDGREAESGGGGAGPC